MGVRAAELLLAVHTERVVPDYPAPAGEADFPGDELQFGGVFVADRQPESPRRLEDVKDPCDPLPRPVEIMLGLLRIVVDVVIVADVKRGVGEGEIDAARGDFFHPRDAVPFIDRVRLEHSALLLNSTPAQSLPVTASQQRGPHFAKVGEGCLPCGRCSYV
jgi:hypothetical protein